ncbi:MAG TPA: electron transfer flavoprotein subunit alpha/FixB family protein [Desulfomonilia bacterium]|nr:electron transfer flavoprotein subunit alpha/FixB family protein [Desulfomonilia bacterium]
MKGDKSPLVVFAEVVDGGKIAPCFFETLHAVQKIAEIYESKVHALILGHNVADIAEDIRHYGIDTIHIADDACLGAYHPEYYLAAFRQAYEQIRPCAVFMGHTLQSIDLAPRMAFDLNAGLLTDCTGIEVDSGEVLFLKPVFSSHILAGYEMKDNPFIVTMRSKSFEPAHRWELKQGTLNIIQVTLHQLQAKVIITDRVMRESAGIKVDDAEIIVAGGRGIGSSEGFKVLADLADTMGAAVGASRPPVDTGWISAESQVGQTGAIVAPAVYFAIGISGAIQHLAGMSQSKKIIAVNKDAEASIFKVADYGAVGVYEEIIPALTQTIKDNLKA